MWASPFVGYSLRPRSYSEREPVDAVVVTDDPQRSNGKVAPRLAQGSVLPS